MIPWLKDEMGSGAKLAVMEDSDGDMLVVMESYLGNRVRVEVTRSPLRRPKVHAALRAPMKAIEEECKS